MVDVIILVGAKAFAPACKIFNKDLLGLLNDQVYNSRLRTDDLPKTDTCSGGSPSWVAKNGPPGRDGPPNGRGYSKAPPPAKMKMK